MHEVNRAVQSTAHHFLKSYAFIVVILVVSKVYYLYSGNAP